MRYLVILIIFISSTSFAQLQVREKRMGDYFKTELKTSDEETTIFLNDMVRYIRKGGTGLIALDHPFSITDFSNSLSKDNISRWLERKINDEAFTLVIPSSKGKWIFFKKPKGYPLKDFQKLPRRMLK